MERMGIRDLRNHTSGAIRRAMAGERIVITIDGVPAAQLGPLNTGESSSTIEDLIAAGLLQGPRATSPPPPPPPPIVAPGPSSTEILREHRSR
jgi:prevent-host-death family protein